MKKELLKKIPAVNDLLDKKYCQELISQYSRNMVLHGIREVTDKIRQSILADDFAGEKYLSSPEVDSFDMDIILREVEEYLMNWQRPNLKPAVNATGVVVHTNLGRSLLSESALNSLEKVAVNYSTLEIEESTGERGSRYDNVAGLLQDLTGAGDCLVVNNNAGAVMLALNTLAEGREVVIPRGELVEIGGSFRIPDVMKRSGAKLVEVGATNKVYLDDYKQAVTGDTGLLLKVHTSNYRIVGFTRGVPLKELVEYAHSQGLPVLDDLGSGIFVDLSDYGFSHEPTVRERVEAGADVITFSGDKLLGGPQAGIIVGKNEYIEKMKRNPLTRALRVDKLTLAALEATLKEYKKPQKVYQNIPTLQMLTQSEREIAEKADKLLDILKKIKNAKITLHKRKDIARVGGGAFPLEELPTHVVEVEIDKYSAEELSRQLRLNYPPIFTRIARDKVLIDLRTVKMEDLSTIKKAVSAVAN